MLTFHPKTGQQMLLLDQKHVTFKPKTGQPNVTFSPKTEQPSVTYLVHLSQNFVKSILNDSNRIRTIR